MCTSAWLVNKIRTDTAMEATINASAPHKPTQSMHEKSLPPSGADREYQDWARLQGANLGRTTLNSIARGARAECTCSSKPPGTDSSKEALNS